MLDSNRCPCHGHNTSSVPIIHTKETAFEMAASCVRYGLGVTSEIGAEMHDAGFKRVLLVTDSNVRKLHPVITAIKSLEAFKIVFDIFDQVNVEPTDESMLRAIAFARKGNYDAAKVANLYSSFPSASFLDFVNAPVGLGKPVPGPVKPLYAVSNQFIPLYKSSLLTLLK